LSLSEKVVMLLKHTCYQCRVPPHNEHPTYFGDKIMHKYNKMTTQNENKKFVNLNRFVCLNCAKEFDP